MSDTFHLICPAKRLQIWIGQGNFPLVTLYSGSRSTMDALGAFLVRTRGEPVFFVSLEYDYGDWIYFEDLTPAEGPL